jgi:hypothetical protein
VDLTCKKIEHGPYLHRPTQITFHPLDWLGLILPQAEHSNILTPGCRIFLVILIVSQLLKKFPALFGEATSITVFTSVRSGPYPSNPTSRRQRIVPPNSTFAPQTACSVLDFLPKILRVLLIIVHFRWVPCHHGMERPQVADGGDALQLWRAAAIILNKPSRTADKGWSSSLGVERGTNSSPSKISLL